MFHSQKACKMAQLPCALFPPIPPLQICEGLFARKVTVIEKWFLLVRPVPSLLKISHTAPKTKPCRGSSPQLYPACWWLLVSDLQHHVCTAQQCLQLVQRCNPVDSWSVSYVPSFLLQSCCLSHPHPLSTHTPAYSYQSLIFCICPDWTASKITEHFCLLVTSFKPRVTTRKKSISGC